LTWGDSSVYDALQTRVQKRLSKGFQIVGSFTWQKSIDGHSSTSFPTNSIPEFGLYAFHQPQVEPRAFRLQRGPRCNHQWPVASAGGKERTWALKLITEAWQLGGSFQVNDGMPFTPLNGDALGQKSGGTYDVPNRVVAARARA
jgi:hypothetical protein